MAGKGGQIHMIVHTRRMVLQCICNCCLAAEYTAAQIQGCIFASFAVHYVRAL